MLYAMSWYILYHLTRLPSRTFCPLTALAFVLIIGRADRFQFLLVEAAQVTARSIPEWRSKYSHLMMRRGGKIAKVAMARRLAIRLYWIWRKGWDYEQVKKFGSRAGKLGTGRGVQ